MKKRVIDKGWPTISYIVNNWPRTKNILKKFILSNHKKPNLFDLSVVCLNELKVFKIQEYKPVLFKLSKLCSRNIYFNTYHDQHHLLIFHCVYNFQLIAKLKLIKVIINT